jgi:hypothetical protein
MFQFRDSDYFRHDLTETKRKERDKRMTAPRHEEICPRAAFRKWWQLWTCSMRR